MYMVQRDVCRAVCREVYRWQAGSPLQRHAKITVHECRLSVVSLRLFLVHFPYLLYIPPPAVVVPPRLTPSSSYRRTPAVVRTPEASDGFFDTSDGLIGAFHLLPAGVAQQLDFLQDLQGVHVLDADGLLAAVDVVADEHGVPPRPRRHREFDLRVLRRELGELRPDEGAVRGQLLPVVFVARVMFDSLYLWVYARPPPPRY